MVDAKCQHSKVLKLGEWNEDEGPIEIVKVIKWCKDCGASKVEMYVDNTIQSVKVYKPRYIYDEELKS